jgi:hypothetical protein
MDAISSACLKPNSNPMSFEACVEDELPSNDNDMLTCAVHAVAFVYHVQQNVPIPGAMAVECGSEI